MPHGRGGGAQRFFLPKKPKETKFFHEFFYIFWQKIVKNLTIFKL
jgi:hypothetical protein